MSKEQKKLFAIDIKRATTVAVPTGGSVEVLPGAVLLVPGEVSGEDASYLIALGKGVACEPKLKAERAKASSADKK